MEEGKHPMIGASKILTVSYGTFSCTLEGFDDPFNTMRAIAEYFRDLAAEDRYFGAEPPTPDAAMLHKIAEREVQRRVEAKIQDNGVILRTGDAMQAPAYVPPPQPQPTVVAPQPIAATTPQQAPMPDGVAAKLLRIRAAVANAELAEPFTDVARAPITPVPAQPILTDYSEDEHADAIGTAGTLTATFAPKAFVADIVEADIWLQPLSAAPDAGFDEDLVTDDHQDTAAEVLAEDTSFADEPPLTDAAQDAEEIEVAFDASQDDHPQFASGTADSDTAFAPMPEVDDSLLASLNDKPVQAPVTDPSDFATADGTSDPEDHAISEDEMADLRALDGDVNDVTADAEAVMSTDEDYDEDYDDLADTAETDATDARLDAEFDDAPPAAELTPTAIDPVIEEIDSVYDEPDTSPTPGPSEKVLRARARVIKVRRDDATSDPEVAPAGTETIAADAAAGVAAMLAADAEADLRRELRAVQQQTAPTSATPPADQDEEAGPEDDARQRLDTAGEAAVSRLIEQTNEAMAVPENRRRLSAIAHLKAAVAATVADRFAKGGAAPKEVEAKRLDPYREDLARVVRPQHPTGTEDAPSAPRPAPLVLVSAQRIDRPRAAPGDTPTPLSAVPNSPIRPRRVTSAVLAVEPAPDLEDEDEDGDTANVFSDARGFAEFSERLGANSLAEILEAAAAYSVCIEGRPYFSRPQLMSQIGALSADSEYTREDGLRTFGALLREGRIQKIKRGQFVLTENSRYLVEARNLAG